MSKMGKFLASKKKLGVKARVDSALQALATPEADSAPADVKNVSKVSTDDWGADSDSDRVGDHASIRGHFHLITEEDVSKKQQRKPVTWDKIATENLAEEEKKKAEEEKVEEESKKVEDEKYRAPQGLPDRHQKLDFNSASAFPPMGVVQSATAQTKKKEKTRQTVGQTVTPPITDETKGSSKETARIEDAREGTLMLIEEFLLDIVKPEMNVVYDDEASKLKFIGRKKRRCVVLPASD